MQKHVVNFIKLYHWNAFVNEIKMCFSCILKQKHCHLWVSFNIYSKLEYIFIHANSKWNESHQWKSQWLFFIVNDRPVYSFRTIGFDCQLCNRISLNKCMFVFMSLFDDVFFLFHSRSCILGYVASNNSI